MRGAATDCRYSTLDYLGQLPSDSIMGPPLSSSWPSPLPPGTTALLGPSSSPFLGFCRGRKEMLIYFSSCLFPPLRLASVIHLLFCKEGRAVDLPQKLCRRTRSVQDFPAPPHPHPLSLSKLSCSPSALSLWGRGRRVEDIWGELGQTK